MRFGALQPDVTSIENAAINKQSFRNGNGISNLQKAFVRNHTIQLYGNFYLVSTGWLDHGEYSTDNHFAGRTPYEDLGGWERCPHRNHDDQPQ
jgi:hypothetical protein